MSSKQLFIRNGRYYFRQWIPLDLRFLYGERVELVRSLKTADKKQAHGLASGLHQKYSVAFSLLRSGLIPPDLIQSLVSDTLPKQPVQAPRPPVPHKITLSSLIDLFIREHSPNWTDKSLQEFTGQFRLLLMTLEDKPVDGYDRTTCLDCRYTLLKVPPGFSKKKKLKDLPLPSLVALGLPGLAPKTVNKYLILLSSVFKWAVKHGHMERNPAEGLTLEIHQKADEERKAYDLDDLKRVVVNLPADDPAKRWIPLVAMYSGMRLEEICQLTPEDIQEVDRVLCILVHEEGDKRTKTKASIRIVPVHPALLQLGLMEYVKSRPKGNLWGLSRGKWGYGKKITNWWSRSFNRQNITDDPLKCFHSFRHTFADTLKQIGVQETLISELMGHANGSITTGRYGKRYKAGVLFETICMVNYDLG